MEKPFNNQEYFLILMKSGLIFLVFILGICRNNAQDICNGVQLDTMHGKWIVIPGGSIPNIPKAILNKERQYMDAVNDLIRKNWKWAPIGGDIGYGSFFVSDDHRPDSVIKKCDTYYTSFEFKKFDCDNGKITHTEVADYVDTYFNELPFKFEKSFYTPGPDPSQAELIDPYTDVYGMIPWLPVVKEGYFDYVMDNNDGTEMDATDYVYKYRTIFKKGKLPYLLMPKKEYYEKWIKKYTKEINNIEVQKINSKKELAGLDNLPSFLKKMDEYIGINQNFINQIDNLLKTKTTEELSKPALEGEQEGKYFETIQESFYKAYIIKPNYNYYSNANKYSPQVITIKLRYLTGKNESGVRVYADAGFYQALKEMHFFDLMVEKLQPFLVQ